MEERASSASQPPGYTASVARGGAWTLLGTVYGLALVLVRAAVLARLLAPEHFGAFALVLLALTVVDIFSHLGLGAAVVQRSKLDEKQLNLVWTLNVARGMIISGALWTVAPLFGWAFVQPELPHLIRWGCFALVIAGLSNPGLHVLERKMLFRRRVFAGVIGQTLTLLCTIAVAWRWPSAEALLAGYVMGAMVRCIISYAVWPFSPRVAWDWPLARELLKFGRSVVWVRITASLMSNVDNAVIGRVLGKASLGLYSMTYNVVTLPGDKFSQPVNRAVFAAFCRLQEVPDRLVHALVRTLRIMAGVICPAMIGLALLSSEAVELYLGPKWKAIGTLIPIVAVASVLRILGGPLGHWLIAVGHPQKLVRMRQVELILFVAVLVPMTWWCALPGAAAALVVLYLMELIASIVLVRQLRPETTVPVLRVIMLTALPCGLMGAMVWALRMVLIDHSALARTLTCVPAGAVVYLLATWVLNRSFYQEFLEAWRAVRTSRSDPKGQNGVA